MRIRCGQIVYAFLFLVISSTSFATPIKCKNILSAKEITEILKQKDRPDLGSVVKYDLERLWTGLEQNLEQENDPRFYKVLEAANIELLKEMDGREIFFVARDGEWFYDAMTAAIHGNPKAGKLMDRVHLLNLSRNVAYQTVPKNLAKYLEANGLDIESILQGKKRVILVDTGERGSIFVNMFQKIVQAQDFSGKDWKERLENLLMGIEVRLLHSSMKDNRSQLIARWKKKSEFNAVEIIGELEDIGFSAMITDKRKSLGVPTQHWELHHWIVQEFERRKHWLGRATAVSANGNVTQFQDVDKDKKLALASQARIIWHFTQGNVLKMFEGPLMAALESCGLKCGKSRTEKLKAAAVEPIKANEKLVKVESGVQFKNGDIAVTTSGAKYRIVKFLDQGKRGSAYRAEALADGKSVVVKVAVDSEADTLKSFAEEKGKNKGYAVAGIPHAAVIELGKNFMVKEFIDGVRADVWLQSWIKEGMPSGTVHLKVAAKMLKIAASKGVYVGDLNSKNLIWDGKKWVVVDSGTWRDDLSEAEILERYEDKFIGRWTKDSDVRKRMSEELGLVN